MPPTANRESADSQSTGTGLQTWEQQVEVSNAHGLHAMPAQRVARVARSYESAIRIRMDDRDIDAKETLSLLTLAAEKGAKLTVSGCGVDAQQAVEAVVALVRGEFDDELASRLCKH